MTEVWAALAMRRRLQSHGSAFAPRRVQFSLSHWYKSSRALHSVLKGRRRPAVSRLHSGLRFEEKDLPSFLRVLFAAPITDRASYEIVGSPAASRFGCDPQGFLDAILRLSIVQKDWQGGYRNDVLALVSKADDASRERGASQAISICQT